MPELEVTIKRMKVPSANFPTADLRVEPNARYEFKCICCSQSLAVPLDWIASTGLCTNKVDAQVLAAIDHHFYSSSIKVPHSQQNNIVQSHSCNSIYIVYVRAEETSVGAFRATVSSVNQVLIHEG